MPEQLMQFSREINNAEPVCSVCWQRATITCKIGTCAPETLWCDECYQEKHLPEEDGANV